MEITIAIVLLGVFNIATLALLGYLIRSLLSISPKTTKSKHTTTSTDNDSSNTPATSEDKAQEEASRMLKNELEALNELMHYNADVAYGITPRDEE